MLLDWLLPGIDGLELCRRVRSLRGRDEVILVVTARGGADDLAAVLDAGADDYLPKPFDIAMLDVRLTVAERTVMNVQARRVAEETLKHTWQTQGVLLAARTVEHLLGNQLALTMGYSELIAIDPTLPDEFRPMAQSALRGVIQACETLAQLRRIIRLEETAPQAGIPILDLERCATAETRSA
jgi:CheY-like chemotaxis protein